MSEQNDNIEQEAAPEVEQKQYSAVELEAMEQGWRPKEEFEGEPERFIDAPEFLRRGELFSKIDHQSKELKQLRGAIEQFKNHHANVEKAAYDRAIKDLKAQRKAALQEGDVDRFDELDNEIEEVTDARDKFVQQAQRAQAVPTIDPAFTAWVSKNPWYTNDPIMSGAADKLGQALAREGLPPLEVLKRVEAEIKKTFPQKFSNPNRERPAAVESPAPRGAPTKSRYSPTEDEKRVAQTFVRAKLYNNVDEYYAELQAMEKGKK